MEDTALDPQGFDDRYKDDAKLYVVFYTVAVKQGHASELAGRPIFKDVPHIRIRVPGDKTQVTEREASAEDHIRFAKQWERYQNQLTQAPEGTPLEQWPQLTTSQVHELKAMGIMTVEHLSHISDANAMKWMGGMELRKRAEAFLRVSADTAAAQAYAVRNEELEQELAQQKETTRQLAQRLEVLEEARKLTGIQ